MQTSNQNELAVTLLQDVNEDSRAFWFNHGTVAKNLRELNAALTDMNADEFAYHVNAEKNDLANWVEFVIGDESLATKLRLLSTLEATRRMVARRVDELTALLPVEAPAEVVAPVAAEAVEAVAPAAPVAPKTVKAKKSPAKKAKAKKVTAKAVASPSAKAMGDKTKRAEAPVAKKTSLFGRLLKR